MIGINRDTKLERRALGAERRAILLTSDFRTSDLRLINTSKKQTLNPYRQTPYAFSVKFSTLA